jgi:hypothetical protein
MSKKTLLMNNDVSIFDLSSTGRGHCPYIVKTLAYNHARGLIIGCLEAYKIYSVRG